ncbi:helix-turn-helix domain-containing protein [Rhodococcus qingshengii]|jgi:transcriptional regulator with XRE-family HTH domain|uniref:Helix-turn-helix transcriptional regulator n=2 Tax=Rhodococcus erythropolis group TaxID=2840174 RepID=A0A8I1D2M0_RHOER|nr:helix-turn-helix domain-containing protein [Rhodococcus erythropolis]MBH5141030.1 helix-turn-helix transcriptional regulator [Rhodococcus erythropolis]
MVFMTGNPTDSVVRVSTGGGVFRDRLNDLFAASQTRLTNLSVAKGLLLQDFRISVPYLSQLRTGVRDNPSDEVVAALANYFGVAPECFFEIPDRGECECPQKADAEIVKQLTDPDMRRLLTLAHGLSAESIELLADMANRIVAADRRLGSRFPRP